MASVPHSYIGREELRAMSREERDALMMCVMHGCAPVPPSMLERLGMSELQAHGSRAAPQQQGAGAGAAGAPAAAAAASSSAGPRRNDTTSAAEPIHLMKIVAQQGKGAAKERACAQCGTTAGELKKCSACSKVYYCSVPCQRSHWRSGHKAACNAALQQGNGAGSIIVADGGVAAGSGAGA